MKTFNFFFINCALTIKPQTRHWERHTRRSRQNFNIQNAKFSKLCEILMIKHHLDWMNNSCVKKFSSVNIFLVKNRKLFLWRTKIKAITSTGGDRTSDIWIAKKVAVKTSSCIVHTGRFTDNFKIDCKCRQDTGNCIKI